MIFTNEFVRTRKRKPSMLSAVKDCVCNHHSLCHVVILRWEGLVLRWENGWQARTSRRTKSNWKCYLPFHFLDCEWLLYRFVPHSIYGRTFVRFWWMYWSWASRFQSLTELKFLKMSFVFQKNSGTAAGFGDRQDMKASDRGLQAGL